MRRKTKPAPPPREDKSLLLKENEKLRRRLSVRRGVEEVLTAMIADSMDTWKLQGVSVPQVPVLQTPRKPAEECVALVHVTDLQCGKVTKTYNSEICRDRCMELAEKVTKAVHKRNAARGITTLHVYWGGDMVEGELIFPHQAHQIDSSVFEQATITVPKILTEMTLHWLQTFRQIKIFAVRGNHGRPASKHAGSNPKTNWDSVAYSMAQVMIEKAMSQAGIDPKRVRIKIAEDWYLIDECLGHKNMLIHGDVGIRGFGGFPWYGVARRMAGWIDSVPETWQNLYFGHFHQFVSADYNGRRWYCGGTPESDNEWARSELAATGRPQQRLQLLNREQVVCDLPIYLDSGYRPTKKSKK
jgi:hypothetical protein